MWFFNTISAPCMQRAWVQLVCDTEDPLPAVLGIFMVHTAHTTPCLSSSGSEREKERHFQGCVQNRFLKTISHPPHGLMIAKGGCYTFWKVSIIVSKMLCQAVVHSPASAVISIFQTSYFLYYLSMFSSQALIDCIERFGNKAYQDLVP